MQLFLEYIYADNEDMKIYFLEKSIAPFGGTVLCEVDKPTSLKFLIGAASLFSVYGHSLPFEPSKLDFIILPTDDGFNKVGMKWLLKNGFNNTLYCHEKITSNYIKQYPHRESLATLSYKKINEFLYILPFHSPHGNASMDIELILKKEENEQRILFPAAKYSGKRNGAPPPGLEEKIINLSRQWLK